MSLEGRLGTYTPGFASSLLTRRGFFSFIRAELGCRWSGPSGAAHLKRLTVRPELEDLAVVPLAVRGNSEAEESGGEPFERRVARRSSPSLDRKSTRLNSSHVEI